MSRHETRVNIERQPFPDRSHALAEHLRQGVESLLTDRRDRFLQRSEPSLSEKIIQEHEFLTHSLVGVLDERLNRAEELDSPEVQRARELAKSMLPGKLAIVDCVDGRMPPSVVFGIVPGMAKGYRSAAGNLPGYEYNDETGELVLDPQSGIAAMLEGFSNGDKSQKKFEALGSHIGCAAQLREERMVGREPDDHGLFKNVRTKNQKGKQIRKYDVLPMQYSFDPSTGFTYWGLEKPEVLQLGEENGDSYSEDLLVKLSSIDQQTDDSQPWILSTNTIAERYAEVFQEHAFDVNWAGKYKDSALSFWTGMKAMEESVLPEVEDMARELYRYSAAHDIEDPQFIRMTAVLMLSNAFSAWLHTQEGRKFPFDMHDEKGIVVSRKSKGPFKQYPALVVPPDAGTLGRDLCLTQGIVRENRRYKSAEQPGIEDPSDTYAQGSQEWVEAPVSVIYKAELPFKNDDSSIWEAIRQIDWSQPAQLPDDSILPMKYAWKKIDRERFDIWMNNNSHIEDDVDFQKIVDTLYSVAANIRAATTDADCGSLIKRGGLVIVPLLVSSGLQPQSVVPFST